MKTKQQILYNITQNFSNNYLYVSKSIREKQQTELLFNNLIESVCCNKEVIYYKSLFQNMNKK